MNKNLKINPATINDFNFVKKLILEGVEEKHYKKDLVQSDILLDQTIKGILTPGYNSSLNAGLQTLIISYNTKQIGFVTMKSMQGGIVEFWYFSLTKENQNKGYGTEILKELESKYNSIAKNPPLFTARCNNESENMISILEKNNYKRVKSKNEEGWYHLFKCDDKKFLNEIISKYD